MQQRTDNMKISKNNISIAGEFAVLAQLALRGIDANLDAIRMLCKGKVVKKLHEKRYYRHHITNCLMEDLLPVRFGIHGLSHILPLSRKVRESQHSGWYRKLRFKPSRFCSACNSPLLPDYVFPNLLGDL